MKEFQENPVAVNFLRLTAIIGVCLALLWRVLSAEPFHQNEHFSFYALAVLSCAIVITMLIFVPKATALILRNPDLFVPIGIYIAANWLVGIVGRPGSFWGFENGQFSLQGLTVNVLLTAMLKIVFVICFAGWTTRLLLDLVATGRVDLVSPLVDIRNWFSRSALAVAVGTAPFFFLIIVIMASAGLIRWSGKVYEVFILFFLPLVAIGTLVWNLATSALLPSMMEGKTVRESIRLSWSNKSRLALPLIVMILISGWMVFLIVTFDSYKDDPKEFGTNFTSHSISTKTQFTTNFIWAGGYPEDNKWYEVLMKTVESKAPATMDLRIALLMLILSLAVNLQIILTLRGSPEEIAEHPEIKPVGAGRMGLIIGAAFFLLVPFEYVILQTPFGKHLTGKGDEVFSVPKVYKGGDLFKKTEVLRYERSMEWPQNISVDTGAIPPATDESQQERIVQVYTGEVDSRPGTDLFVIGEKKAFILSSEGALKQTIKYDLEKYFSDNIWNENNFYSTKVVDLDQDGRPEIAGWGYRSGHIVDLTGRAVWRYSEIEKLRLGVQGMAVGDVDGDGRSDIIAATGDKLEAYSRDGKLKWSTGFSSFLAARIEIVDTDGDGKNEVVADNIVFEGHTGQRVNKVELPERIMGYLREKDGPVRILYFNDNKLGIFNFERLTAKFEAPLSDIPAPYLFPDEYQAAEGRLFAFDSEGVYFNSGRARYLAAVAHVSGRGDSFSALYIYDSTGTLVYHETIANSDAKITAFAAADGAESILLTERGKIFKYSLN